MSTQAPVNIEITNGPAADRLCDALKYAFDDALKYAVKLWFELQFGPDSIGPYATSRTECSRVLAQIIGIVYESGASGMLNVTANMLDGQYELFYNANTRKGKLVRKIS